MGALAEGLLLIGWYLPGSGIVILGAAFSAEGDLDIIIVTLLAATGFIIAYVINYALGRHGWFRLLSKFGMGNAIEQKAAQLKARGLAGRIWLWALSCFHPNSGGIMATVCGVLRVRFVEFVAIFLLATLVWTCLWAAAVYWLGSTVIMVLSSWLVVPLVFLFFFWCMFGTGILACLQEALSSLSARLTQ